MDLKLHDEAGRLAALRRYEVLDTPPEEPFERLTGLVRAVLNVPIATLTLIDQDRQFYKSCVGMAGTDIPREHSFCTHTIQTREPLLIPDTLLDQRFAQNPAVIGEPYVRSYFGVPLKSPEGYNLGSLCALDLRPRSLDPAQIEVMKSFAALAVDELELRRIAQTDSLTGAATRRSFLLEMEKALAKYARRGTPTVLLTMDIDHFKQVNDNYGHPAGDEVLCGISNQLQTLLRKEDLLGRLGGEEFGILLADTDVKQAVLLAERLRSAIAASRPLGDRQITASFGIAGLQLSVKTPDGWLAAADRALYAAKYAGRNQCCLARL